MTVARELHRVVGFSLAGCWALLLGAGVGLALRKRDAGRLYWGWGLLVLLQLALGLQLVAGLVQLALGGQPQTLHWVYGAVLPAGVLVLCHVLTRGLVQPPYHLFFTWAALLVFGLTGRALMTGFA
jgi:hypothetical protein